jgi:hypothetical protein
LQQIDFTLNAFNAMGVTRNEHAATKLASAVIKMEVPHEIFEDLGPQRYKEIREFYAGLREPFHNTLAQLTQVHGLDSICDPKVLSERVVELATEFDAQIVKLKQTEFGRKMKRWVPVGIGCALSVVGQAFHQPLITASATGVSLLLKVYDRYTSQNAPNSEREHVQRLIGKMQEDIFEASPFTVFA